MVITGVLLCATGGALMICETHAIQHDAKPPQSINATRSGFTCVWLRKAIDNNALSLVIVIAKGTGRTRAINTRYRP